ncbi:MAG: phosphotransferase family protein [Deltaproteobacteria bacterium]|nr:phosphotransferase family protein [Deltaproteobacteria bacterium]MBW2723003.1 phosphotransferase family protein [Deltaproteobacteria bacterium]
MDGSGNHDDLAQSFRSWLCQRLDIPALDLSDFEVPGHGGMSHDSLLCSARWSGDQGPRQLELVVRIEPAEPHIFPRYDLSAQARVMQLLKEHTQIPVPKVLWSESDSAVLGRPFFVMERVAGEVPSDNPPFLVGGWLHDATPQEQATAQSSLVDQLAGLHRLDWQELGFDFLDRAQFGALGLDQDLGYWRHYLDWMSEDGELPVLEAVYEWCAKHAPTQTGPTVLNWGDARYGNVIYGEDFWPAAIIDWEMALLGPAEIDLGWFLFLHDTALMWLKDLPGFVGREELVSFYAKALGRELRDLHFFEVWAGFRAAAIRARLVQCDYQRGVCKDLKQQERSPVVLSLRRLIELPEAK